MPTQTTFPVDEAQLMSVITEGIFYGEFKIFKINEPQSTDRNLTALIYTGIYLVTFFACIHDLLVSHGHDLSCVLKRRKDIHVKMIIGAICLLFFATLDLAAGIKLNLRVFLSLRGNTAEDFGDISYWVNVLKMVSFVGQLFTGDTILLYRCWVIYGRNCWVIAAPAIMLVAELICGCFEIYTESTFGPGRSLVVYKQFAPYIITVIVLTVCVNISVTSLIIWRIWSIISNAKKLFPSRTRSPLSDAIRILLDSGLIYTSSALVMLITYIVSNNASYLVSDCLVQIIGITFNLIIIRVGRGTATRSFDKMSKTPSQLPERRLLNFRETLPQSRTFDASSSSPSLSDVEAERFHQRTVVDDGVRITPLTKAHSVR
ncbi:hypothetical protein DFJ43DRAFT_1150788 [Lentinula guzmanii]|uniref:Uncharacterized protein n=1 Tax=Lentinula guzmanii TaxID=2804957 RepID=A0AA38N4G8_9AGAR|nr:hypothetical protein DFJ43DRAFT_1150788 [Lentinula guzmanii]